MILLRNIEIDGSARDVLIEKDVISKIAPAGSSREWEIAGDIEMMDCSGKVAIPGFVNMHTHAGMSLMRGIGEDMVFHDRFLEFGVKTLDYKALKDGKPIDNIYPAGEILAGISSAQGDESSKIKESALNAVKAIRRI